MEYIFGRDARTGCETVRTKGAEHSTLTGFCETVREYPDCTITDSFFVCGHIRSAEDEEGNLQLSPHLRALADTDFGEGDLITSIWDYYHDCYWKIAENGVGYYTFQNVIEGDQLFNEWQYNNQNNLHWSSYIDGILNELGASYCHISMEVERLQDNRYLITHTVSVGK